MVYPYSAFKNLRLTSWIGTSSLPWGCARMLPKMMPDVATWTWDIKSHCGCFRIGSLATIAFNCWSAFSHSSIQTTYVSFLENGEGDASPRCAHWCRVGAAHQKISSRLKLELKTGALSRRKCTRACTSQGVRECLREQQMKTRSNGTAETEDKRSPQLTLQHIFCKPHPYLNKGAYGFHFVKGIWTHKT